MDHREQKLLYSLVLMVRQYLHHYEDGLVETLCMSAGENAIRSLAEYGLMEVVEGGRFGKWTEAGEAFWEAGPYREFLPGWPVLAG